MYVGDLRAASSAVFEHGGSVTWYVTGDDHSVTARLVERWPVSSAELGVAAVDTRSIIELDCRGCIIRRATQHALRDALNLAEEKFRKAWPNSSLPVHYIDALNCARHGVSDLLSDIPCTDASWKDE